LITALSPSLCVPPRAGRWPAASNFRARRLADGRWAYLDAFGRAWLQDARRVGRTWLASHFDTTKGHASIYWPSKSRPPRVRVYSPADLASVPGYGADYDPQLADYASWSKMRGFDRAREQLSRDPLYVLESPIFGRSSERRRDFLAIDPGNATLRLVEFVDDQPRCSCRAALGCAHIDLVVSE
jgi:hypothetical protein